MADQGALDICPIFVVESPVQRHAPKLKLPEMPGSSAWPVPWLRKPLITTSRFGKISSCLPKLCSAPYLEVARLGGSRSPLSFCVVAGDGWRASVKSSGRMAGCAEDATMTLNWKMRATPVPSTGRRGAAVPGLCRFGRPAVS